MSMAQGSKWYVGTDMVAEVNGLRTDAGDFENSAQVQITAVRKENGEDVDGITLPIDLTYVVGSSGRYRGIVPYTAEIVVGEIYELVIDVVGANRAQFYEYAVAMRKVA